LALPANVQLAMPPGALMNVSPRLSKPLRSSPLTPVAEPLPHGKAVVDDAVAVHRDAGVCFVNCLRERLRCASEMIGITRGDRRDSEAADGEGCGGVTGLATVEDFGVHHPAIDHELDVPPTCGVTVA